jgi:colicin import membrane protein
VRVWLGIAAAEYGDRVACFDQESREIGDYEEINRARNEAELRAAEAEAKAAEAETKAAEAEARAEQESASRAELERRLHALEEELQRVRGDAGQP